MGGLFGGKTAKVNKPQPESTLRIQTSIQGRPRAIGWGLARLSGNMIWYGDFQAVEQQQQSSGGGKGGGGGCFAPEVIISGPTGSICIGDIQPGDLVWCVDPQTGEVVEGQVQKVLVHDVADTNDKMIHIIHEAALRPLHVTTNHFMWDDNYPDFKREAGSYRVGDTLVHEAFGDVEVIEVIDRPQIEKTYNLVILPYHNFFADGILAHNGGGGGSGKGSGTYDYYASVALGICEGPVSNVMTIYANNSVDYLAPQIVSEAVPSGTTVTSGTSTYNSTTFVGSYSQQPWSRFTSLSAFPNFTPSGFEQALVYYLTHVDPITNSIPSTAYRGLCYVSMNNMNMGSSNALPNFTFEVLFGINSDIPSFGPDANPADIFYDILTNSNYGLPGFPVACIGDMSNFKNYCRASGLLISPVLSDSKSANSMMQEILEGLGVEARWSGGVLDFIPYAETASSNYGYTYTPNMTPIYALTDNDFIVGSNGASDGSPITIHRKRAADLYNVTRLEYLDRSQAYNPAVVEQSDAASINFYARQRIADLKQMHFFVDSRAATTSASIQLQRAQISTTYNFTLGPQYILLDPMDIVTLTHAAAGLDNVPVRITEIQEQSDKSLGITAEEVFGTVSAPRFGHQASAGFQLNANTDPGGINVPYIFEAPWQITGAYEISVALSGQDTSIWGGANIYVSYDNLTYKLVGEQIGNARHGYLTNAIPAVPTGSNGEAVSDSINPLKVYLTQSKLALVSGSLIDMEALNTACFVGGEVIAYRDATLTGQAAYTLSPLKRGGYGSKITNHGIGDQFARLGNSIFTFAYDDTRVGQMIYIKFQSLNIYGGGAQDISTLTPYNYTITGPGVPHDVTNLNEIIDPNIGVVIGWTPVIDKDLFGYEVRQGNDWATGTALVTNLQSNSYKIGLIPAGTETYFVKAINLQGHYSINAVSVQAIIVSAPSTTLSGSFDGPNYVLKWNLVQGSLATDFYEIRYGSSWAAGTLVGTVKGTQYSAQAAWVGNRNFYISAVDIAGNYGTVSNTTLSITAPSVVSNITQEVIDNNILLKWSASTGTLPISSYEVRKGAIYSLADVVGHINGTFDVLFETQSGQYTYWLTAIDAAGNYGVQTAVTATVSQPPDYLLKSNLQSSLNGIFINMIADAGSLVGPVNTLETWAGHFTTRSWSGPQAQISAGYPYYAEPTATIASYEEIIDYGAVLGGTKITVTLTSQQITGNVIITPTISIKKILTDNWTNYPNVNSVYGTDFRYVKVRYDFAGDDKSLIRVSSINVRLDIKNSIDGGTATAIATDAGGTFVAFNSAFVDVTSIVVTSKTAAARYAYYDFVDVPYPTGFRAYLVDSNGNRVSGLFSWQAMGQRV